MGNFMSSAVQVGEHANYGWLVDVHMVSGRLSRIWISSLAAFWPGMQALIGEIRLY